MVSGAFCTWMKSSMFSGIGSSRAAKGSEVIRFCAPTRRSTPSSSCQPSGVQCAVRASTRSTSRKSELISSTVSPSMDLPTGSSRAMRKKRVSEERYQIWVCRWRCRGSCPRIFTRSTSSALALMSGRAVSWKTTARTLMTPATSEDGQARAVEADPGGLERVELSLAGEGQEQEHGGDQHDQRQPLVELAGHPVQEVLEDRDRRAAWSAGSGRGSAAGPRPR